MNKTEEKELRKGIVLTLIKKKGFNPKIIAKRLRVNICTIYRYLQEEYDSQNRDRLQEALEKILKESRNDLEITFRLNFLTYKEICSVYRRYKSYLGYGHDKTTKINQIAKFLAKFYRLKIAPTKDKSKIKRAFYRQARKCHPDLNKSYDKNGKEFQELYNCYQNILNSLF